MVSNGAKNEPTAYGKVIDMEEEIMEEASAMLCDALDAVVHQFAERCDACPI